MLDLIEHLARWVRGPVLIVCLARDELLDRRPGWGGGRLQRDHDLARPARPPSETRGAGRRAAAAAPPTATPSSPPQVAGALRRQPAVRRGDGQPPASRRARRRRRGAARARCTRCSRPASTRSPATERRLLQARLGGRPDLLGGRRSASAGADRRGPRRATLESLRGQGPDRPDRRRAASPGEREYAFKHVLIRDVAYATLPKAVRCRKHAEVGEFIERARRRPLEGVVAMVAEHYAPRRHARRRGRSRARRAASASRRGRCAASRPPATPPRRSTRTARRSGHYEAALDARAAARPRAARARIGEKLGDVALRLGRVDARGRASGSAASSYHRGEEDLARVGDLHRKIGAGALAQGRARGLDRALPARDRPAQGRPALHRAGAPLRGGRLALHAHRRQHARDLRLREGAAAGRAARRGRAPRAARTGSSAASSAASATPRRRARTSSARSSWRASSDPAEAMRALLTLGYHLEVSEADYDGAARRLRRGARARPARSATCPRRSSCTRRSAQLAVYRGDWETVERETEASRRRSPSARA